jgi:hypothetical protein
MIRFGHRINGFSDFIHRPDSKELEDTNMTFRKLDLFPSSGEGRHLLCWVHRQNSIEPFVLVSALWNSRNTEN